MAKYRKKPVVIDAWQYTLEAGTAPPWIGHAFRNDEIVRLGSNELHIMTLEDGKDKAAKHVASPGDWIVRGIKGEMYPVKPDIFEATYEAVND
jgi:hypothetical protein